MAKASVKVKLEGIKEVREKLEELHAENELLNKRLAAVMGENATLRNLTPVAVLGFWDGASMKVTGISPRDLSGDEVLQLILKMQTVVMSSSLQPEVK